MRITDSYAHRLNTYGVGIGPGAEITMEIERRDGPSVTDVLLVFTPEQARSLVSDLLQSIKDTVVKEGAATPVVHYPTPPADLAATLYGFPYGEETE